MSASLRALIAALADCQAAGRVCVSRCTDHLAAGMADMAGCQSAVMNMLAVTGAMADVAAFRTAAAKNAKALASTCADFCTACAVECEKHSANHEECKACGEACRTCAKACRAWAAEQ
jgi:Cys-rich four helix bundle protein (predicted Tat secretion target)